MHDEILVYGTSNDVMDSNQIYRTNLDNIVNRKSNKLESFRKATNLNHEVVLPWFMLYPDSIFKKV